MILLFELDLVSNIQARAYFVRKLLTYCPKTYTYRPTEWSLLKWSVKRDILCAISLRDAEIIVLSCI